MHWRLPVYVTMDQEKKGCDQTPGGSSAPPPSDPESSPQPPPPHTQVSGLQAAGSGPGVHLPRSTLPQPEA